MNLFIEKGFLENFQIEHSKENRFDDIFLSIFTRYADLKVFFDFDDFEEFLLMSPIFKSIITNTQEYQSINFDVSLPSKVILPRQSILLAEKTKDYHPYLEDLGAICFTYDNYQAKMENILNKCDNKYDLSDPDFSWDWNILSNLSCLPLEAIIVSDPYIFNDGDGQKMDKNIIPLLNVLLSANEIHKKVIVYTKLDYQKDTKITESKHTHINSKLASKAFSLAIFNLEEKHLAELDLHDRLLYSSFFVIEVGKGFNLVGSKRSTSKLETATIFEKFTYDRIRRHSKVLENYANKLIADHPESIYPKKALSYSLV
jgi:hypothetical protein